MFDNRPVAPAGKNVLNGFKDRSKNDLRKGYETHAPAHRQRPDTELRKMHPIHARTSSDPEKPVARVAHHLPYLGDALRDGTSPEYCKALESYRDAALQGEKLLHDEAERGKQTWGSPLAFARVLLMRRIPWPLPSENDLWRYRVLGILVPAFDDILARLTSFHHSPKHPILPLHIRPALLAGVAIVERTGPEILKMLEGHTFGVNRDKFIQATDHLVSPAVEWRPPQQMQLM